MPYQTPLVYNIDSGDYDAVMTRALQLAFGEGQLCLAAGQFGLRQVAGGAGRLHGGARLAFAADVEEGGTGRFDAREFGLSSLDRVAHLGGDAQQTARNRRREAVDVAHLGVALLLDGDA